MSIVENFANTGCCMGECEHQQAVAIAESIMLPVNSRNTTGRLIGRFRLSSQEMLELVLSNVHYKLNKTKEEVDSFVRDVKDDPSSIWVARGAMFGLMISLPYDSQRSYSASTMIDMLLVTSISAAVFHESYIGIVYLRSLFSNKNNLSDGEDGSEPVIA